MSVVPLILILFAATAGLRAVAERLAVPLPTLLVLGGLALALFPGLPRLPLDPDTIFLLFVPPLLFSAALTTSLRDLRRNLRAILLLAVVLVLATIVVVAAAAHALVPNLSWPMCFVLGAIVSPPDAVAVTAVTRRLRLPRNLLTVLEGESLVNDATALVSYQIAVAAAATGAFSLPRAGAQLLMTGAGGLAVGLVAGWCIGWVRRHMRPISVVENTVSLLTPFIAYLPASALGVSGILSVVATGLYLGRRGPHVVSAATRLQGAAMWEMVIFLLEGLIFIFIGLQLPQVVQSLDGGSLRPLVIRSALIGVVMIAFRIAWVFPSAYLPRWLANKFGGKENYPPPRAVLFLGWAGIRGGDSLVIALALPLMAANGMPLAGRNAVIFITFMLILITLVVQGFTLAPLIRLLHLHASHEDDAEEFKARTAGLRAGITLLDRLAAQRAVEPALAAELKQRAERRLQNLHAGQTGEEDVAGNEGFSSYAPLRMALLAAERETIVRMRDDNEISDSVMRRLQSELDHEEMLLRGREATAATHQHRRLLRSRDAPARPKRPPTQ
ncbi:MAG: Na+/H+ antiporter [Steroidobacterales bacterium]